MPFAAHYDQAHIEFLDVDRAHGFYEQVERNTNYIIHPEEILADNFRLLVLGKTDVPSPEVLQRLATALGEARQAGGDLTVTKALGPVLVSGPRAFAAQN